MATRKTIEEAVLAGAEDLGIISRRSTQRALDLEVTGEAKVEIVDPMTQVNVEEFLGYTKWESKANPPADGWWEVVPHLTGQPIERMWFDKQGETWFKTAEDGLFGSGVWAGSFRQTYAWRGLQRPHPDGYDAPPYPALSARTRRVAIPEGY